MKWFTKAENLPHIKQANKKKKTCNNSVFVFQPDDQTAHTALEKWAGQGAGRDAELFFVGGETEQQIYSHSGLQGMETNRSGQTVGEQLYL